MKNILLLTAIIYSFNAWAQVPAIQWSKTYGGDENEILYAVNSTSDGGYIACGETDSFTDEFAVSHGGKDAYVIKTDSFGNMQWQKLFGGSNTDTAYDIKQTPDGGYIMAGFTASSDGDISFNQGESDVLVTKLSSTGEIEWERTYGGTGSEWARKMNFCSDGGYIISGVTFSSDGDVSDYHGNGDCWILKLDNFGNLDWQKTYGGSGSDSATCAQQTSDGNYIVCGRTDSVDGDVNENHGLSDGWLFKLSAGGAILWQKTFGSTYSDYFRSVKETVDGGFIVAGTFTSYHDNFEDLTTFWLIKFNSMSNVEWNYTYGCNDAYDLLDMILTPEGKYLAVGHRGGNIGCFYPGFHGDVDYWLIELDTSGNLEWQLSLGGASADWGFATAMNTQGRICVAGYSFSIDGDLPPNNEVEGRAWMIQVGNEPLKTSTFARDILYVSPNPVLSVLKFDGIDYDRITVTNALGQRVYEQNARIDHIDVENFSPGLYILQAFSGASVYQAKFIKQ